MNAKMPELKRAFEAAGFGNVRTLLSSGNVVFDARERSAAAVEKKAEAAMTKELGRSFYTIVRAQDALRELLAGNPFKGISLPSGAKRVITFVREPHGQEISFPIKRGDARIVGSNGREIFAYYVPGPEGPVFMALIEKTFGSRVTTRTWETVTKCANG